MSRERDAPKERETNLQRTVLALIRREGLLPAGGQVIVGVSGGPDSLCLLHLLWARRDELGIQLHVAHLNHLLRGADAEADARFVAQVAAEWGLPCTVAARDVRALARQSKLALEEAARRARYAFLAEVAREAGATQIAVAHNADDQSETVLMHWLRGAGLAGLRGMLPATRLSDLRATPLAPGSEELWLVRPLLETPRAEVELYCREQGLSPRFDRSNLDTTLYRNKLRHELLPYLEGEYKPGFRHILRRSARVIRDDYDLLCTVRDRAWAEIVRQHSERAVILDRGAWQALHPALQRATLRHAVQHLRSSLRDVNFVHIEAALRVAQQGATGAQATLPQHVNLIVGYETLTLADRSYLPQPDFPSMGAVEPGAPGRISLAVPGKTPLPGQGWAEVDLCSRRTLPEGWDDNPDPWCAYVDAEALGSEPTLRRRRPGDRFCPLGLGGKHKGVNDLLINGKVPAGWRDQIPLLVRADDQIVWVCGWRVDERARVRDETSQVAIVRLRLEG